MSFLGMYCLFDVEHYYIIMSILTGIFKYNTDTFYSKSMIYVYKYILHFRDITVWKNMTSYRCRITDITH